MDLSLSLAINLIIYFSDLLSPSFTIDWPHHRFFSKVTLQQRIHSIYPWDNICSFIYLFTGFFLLTFVRNVDTTAVSRVFLSSSCPTWARTVASTALALLSHDTKRLAAALSGDTLGLRCLLQPLHHPWTAVWTQLFVGPHCGSDRGAYLTWTILPHCPQLKNEAGSVPSVWLVGWSQKWLCQTSWADAMLLWCGGKEETIKLVLPNIILLLVLKYKQM